MKVPTLEQKEALARLIFNRDGKMFDTYLDEALAEARDRLTQVNDPALVRLHQGEARTLLALKQHLNPVALTNETTR